MTLTPSVVASELQTKPDTVYALIRSGRLRAANLSPGGRRPTWRISREALDDFLKGGADPVPQPTRRRRVKAGDVPDYFR